MRVRLAVLAGFVACCVAEAAPPQFGELIEVNVVNVDVLVTDRGGRPVTDLRREDFEVLEDGKRVEVTNFQVLTAGSPASAPLPPPSSSSSRPVDPTPQLPAEERLHLIVYVDNFNLQPAHRSRVLGQLRGFLKDLSPEDRVMMVTNDLGLTVRLPFSGDRAAMEKVLTEIATLPAQGQEAANERRQALTRVLAIREAVRRLDGPCSRMLIAPIESYAETTRQEVLRSINAMTVLVNSLSGVPGRKAVLHVSDGLPVTPGEEVYQLMAEICSGGTTSGIMDVADPDLIGGLKQYSGREAMLDAQRYSTVDDFNKLAAHANAHRVTLYTLQASGLPAPASASATWDQDEVMIAQLPNIHSIAAANMRNSLTLLASETGGKAILDANDVTADLRRMQKDLESYYSLGYTPSHSGDGREHRIEVRVKRPGLQVRHRKSYRDKPAIERAVDKTLGAVYHGFEENPLEVTLEMGAQRLTEGSLVSVPIKLRIPLFKLGIFPQPDGTYRGRLRLLVSTRDVKGGVSPMRQVEVPLQIPPEEVLYAMGKFYDYELTLNLAP
ncbi:MAG TPA: VWA domain-containing protein, partial [Thermoanaerobaculia bacterium]|nr:VWA domain-containing protein [Thermoanaerobaculia bacterium]